ncbi:PEP-CTERM sorting domain-containing protein [bacterium]|nr:PEP-CTERM sorting domain-containing protein [bacterium]
MKKLIVLGIVLTMVMGLAAMVSASETDWLVYLKATNAAGSKGLNSSAIYGTRTGALDGVDSNDANNVAGTGDLACIGCFDLGVGSAMNGYYKDLRAPLTTNATWHIKIWKQDGFVGDQIKLIGWNPTGTYDVVKPVTLSIDSGSAICNGESVTSYTFTGAENGSSTAPLFTWYFDVSEGQTYDLTLAVPEPGSMVAMLSGLVGLVGFGIRRRK